jgi:DNA-binding GntR family transcriptional regulator
MSPTRWLRRGSPLTYFRGKFGRFEVEQDRVIYGELRQRILTRSISLTDSLDVGRLAEELDTLAATVYHAVTRLVADGLLARDPEHGYVVKPVTPESSEQAFDARCAMELGVAATTVGRVPQHRVAALRELMEQTVPLVFGGRFVDVEAYTRHNEAFHNAIVELADNPTLTDGVDALTLATTIPHRRGHQRWVQPTSAGWSDATTRARSCPSAAAPRSRARRSPKTR